MEKRLAMICIAALALLVACAQQSTTLRSAVPAPQTQQADTSAPGASEANAVQVSIENFQFLPAEVTVKPGSSVIWTNNDAATHTLAGDGFSSLELRKGDTFEQKFDKKGAFAYRCGIHPEMLGTVVVG